MQEHVHFQQLLPIKFEACFEVFQTQDEKFTGHKILYKVSPVL